MSKLAASLAAVALGAGLTLAGGGIALADPAAIPGADAQNAQSGDNHTDQTDRSNHNQFRDCTSQHAINLLTCVGVGNILSL